MNKKIVTSLAIVLCVTFMHTALVFADLAATPKEEVVYGMMNYDGKAESVYVVNICEPKDGKVVDYGVYNKVRNMNTDDKIIKKTSRVTVETDSQRLYYEGTLSDAELPWNIGIKYYLDGTPIEGSNLAGKSGKLKIRISISENTSAKGSFFDDYALQGSLSLDTEKCSQIKAEGATIVNVGSKKQLSYIILPGKSKQLVITADVKDFEMSSISFNGMRLNLDVDYDTSKITDMVEKLNDAIKKIDEGSETLKTGLANLYTMTNPASELHKAGSQLQNGFATLSGVYNTGEVVSVDQLMEKNAQAIATLDTQIKACTDTTTQMNLIGLKNLIEGNNQMLAQYKTLGSGTMQYIDGTMEVYDAIDKLNNGVGALSEATGKLSKKTEHMDQEIIDEIDKTIEQLSGGGGETVSFVSSRNTQVDAVQFVLKTDEIKEADKEYTTSDDEEKVSFWQKLKSLF